MSQSKAAGLSAKVIQKTSPASVLDECGRSLFLPALGLIKSVELAPPKDCGDELSRALAKLSDEQAPRSERDRAVTQFEKLSALKAVSDRVSRANLTAGDTWDVSRSRWSEPTLTDLMLATPEMKKYRSRKNDRL